MGGFPYSATQQPNTNTLKLQIKLFFFSLLGGLLYRKIQIHRNKYGVNSPEALAESDAPEFLTKIYQPFYKVKGMVVNNPVSAGMEELEDKMKDMRKSSMDQLNSI